MPISMPPPSRPAAPFKKRRGIQGPALLICTFVVAAIAYASRNSGGFLGLLGFSSSSSPPADMPNWMTKPFDKQEPLNHTVHPYAEAVHTCCKKGSSKCLKVTFRFSQQPPSVAGIYHDAFAQELFVTHGQGVADALNADGVTPLQVASELGNTKVSRNPLTLRPISSIQPAQPTLHRHPRSVSLPSARL